MKRPLPFLLQAAVVLVGMGAFAFLLWAPSADGANAHAGVFKTYFQDPFVAYVYAASIPFFVGLHRAFRLLGHFRTLGGFSEFTVDALQGIRRCAYWVLGSVPGGLAFILRGDPEPPGIILCSLVAVASALGAFGATWSARAVQLNLAPAESGRA